ncbi:MAG: hypothetical protein WBA76_03585, partial [Phormidesmis sp.]
LRIVGDKTGYTITKSADGQGATTEVRDRLLEQSLETTAETAAETAETTVRILAHIAKWTQVAQMGVPTGSQLSTSAVELQIYHKEQLITAESLRLHYEQRDQRWRPPNIKVKLVNHSARRLYCTLLNLTEEYSISAPFFSSGGIWLAPHSEIWAGIAASNQLSDLIPLTVPQRLWEQGVTEYEDTLKLIASTAEFDPTLLLQNKLDDREAIAHRSLEARLHNLFNRLMNGPASRDIGAAETETIDEWMTSQRIITTVRSQTSVQISSERTVALSTNNKHNSSQIIEQVIISPHSQLKAEAKLIAVDQVTRDVAMPRLPPLIQKQTEPLTFTARRGTAPGLDALALSSIEQAESVTPDNPLTLLIDAPLAPGEAVLPIAYDGEFFIPLGYGRHRGKKTEVVLQHLPQLSGSYPNQAQFEDDAPATETRSISSALKIVFRKVATQTLGETLSQKLGLSFDYPILAAVEKTDSAETYITDAAELEKRVAHAKNIVIYVHGITDSTQSMLPSIQAARINTEGQTRPLGEMYDLILTYDYESLNTSVAASAVQLKRKLAAIGIVPGHGKTVHIIAHSMGGLVSRWWVEKEGGDAVIQHLIMLGTPNAGSPWPVVQAGLFKALSFAINGLSTVAWPVQLINGALFVLEAVDVALDDMNPGSELLTLLAASEPAIPYSIVAGNTSLVPLDDKATLRARLERKLDKLAEFPFLQEANDVAVSVSSIRHVPAGAIHVPQVREVACNHMVYFTDPVGLAGLSWAVERAFLAAK